MATFSPASFLERLRAGSLPGPVALTFVGLIQPDADDATGFLFSSASGDESWLPIAADLIESIDHLGTVPHGDRAYPCVRLIVKPEASGNISIHRLMSEKSAAMAAEARSIGESLASQAGASQAGASQAGASQAGASQAGASQAGPSSTARGRCIIFQGMEGLYVCCPPPSGSGPYECTGMV